MPSGAAAAENAGASDAAQIAFFEDEIRPIISEHCVECHGPDRSEGGLQLTTRKAALAELESGAHAVVPGQPGESELIRRVTAEDPDERMPRNADPLSEQQIEKLRRWIDAGAAWPKHWAYRPIVRHEPPEVENEAWVANPVDRFILAKLESEGIEPSPRADRYTLIKRLYYDLLGLPPTPAEVERFVNDESSDAWEKLVDRTLSSPHFGERWGRHWLDKARYADSDGYEKDRPRKNAWRYRDWVIDAVNEDLPFDKFTIWQIAGDLLENPTHEQKLATAFHRQTLTNTEGGTDAEEFRVEAVFDRTETTSAVWLGLTAKCARCHNHKYDRITQKEYYELYAFFNNGSETATQVPRSEQAMADYRKKKAAHEKKLGKLEAKLDQYVKENGADLEKAEAELKEQLANEPPETIRYHRIGFDEKEGPGGVSFKQLMDGSYRVVGPNTAKMAVYKLRGQVPAEGVTAFRLDAIRDPSLPNGGPGRHPSGRFNLVEFEVEAAPTAEFKDVRTVELVRAEEDPAPEGDEKPKVGRAIDGKDDTSWIVKSRGGQSQGAVFWLDEPLEGRPHVRITMRQRRGGQSIGRFRLAAVTGTEEGAGVPQHIRQAIAKKPAERSDEQTEALRRHLIAQDEAGRKLLEDLARVRSQAPEAPMMRVRVIERNPDPRKTHILERGDFLRPGERVRPGVFSVLHELEPREKDGPPDRLDLARWLVDEDNPLTPRVTINHMWKNLFGEGLVRTMNDFGVRGSKPTHPKLLDWLGSEFIRRGWSRKAMVKLIVMSEAYRQSSVHRPELAEVDATNKLLYRQNRFRVHAEIVRDLHLRASGLLSEKVGGPSVFPPMPPDVAALSYANNFSWDTSDGADRYRRGMYTFFKRTAPHPNLTTFDMPDSNTACIERKRSNTPLQALTTLNNRVFVETARAMAERVLSEDHGTDAERIERAFQLCAVRPPSSLERQRLGDVLSASRAWYANHPEEAEKVIGDYGPEGVSAEETAAWFATVRIIMNTDEFITRE